MGQIQSADIDKPTLTIYPVTDKKVETGVVVFPGGGYAHLPEAVHAPR